MMSPSTSCFNLVTSSTTPPLRTVTLVHLGSCRVEDTTYLGRLFNRSAHSPGRAAHRAPNHSSLRRPSSRAAVFRASVYSALPHSLEVFASVHAEPAAPAEAVSAVRILDHSVERHVRADDDLSHGRFSFCQRCRLPPPGCASSSR